MRSWSTSPRLARLLGALVAWLAVAHATADESAPAPAERARLLSDEGVVYFRQHRYDEAIAAFQASYALSPLPELSFDLAQAFRLKGDCARAAEHYRRYLREAPDADNRAQVTQHLHAMEACATPPPAPQPVPPPPPTPTPVMIKPAPIAPSPVAPSHRPRLLQSLGAAGFAVGVASLAAAVYFTVDGQHQADAFSQALDGSDRSRSLRQIDERGRTDNVLAGVLYGVGGAALAGGAVLFGLGKRAERPRSVAAIPIARGGVLIYAGRF